jgi:hypothetical protein
LSALRDAQHAHEGEPVSVDQIAAVCSGPWHRRSDLVTRARLAAARSRPRAAQRRRGGRVADHRHRTHRAPAAPRPRPRPPAHRRRTPRPRAPALTAARDGLPAACRPAIASSSA